MGLFLYFIILAMSVNLFYNFDGVFKFQTEDGKEFIMDERSPKPMQLLLIALLGCTAFDIVDILNKMKVKYEKFKISAEGKRREEYPRKFEYIKITYSFYGENLEQYKEKIERAVYLSQEKYCSVKASLNAVVEYEIKLNDI